MTVPARSDPPPRVSVIMACFNSAETVAESIRSVLAQTFPDWELVLVDDASLDETCVVVRSEIERCQCSNRVSLYRTASNQGTAGARNRAVAHAVGEFVLPLDADDLLAPTMLEHCVAAFGSDRSLDLVFSDRREFGDVERHCTTGPFELDKLTHFNRLSYCAMFRRSALSALGGYRTEVSGFDDWDLWIRAAAAGWRARHLPLPLLAHRRRTTSQMAHALTNYEALFARIIVLNAGVYEPTQVEEARRFLDGGPPGPFLRGAAFVFRHAFSSEA